LEYLSDTVRYRGRQTLSTSAAYLPNDPQPIFLQTTANKHRQD